MNQGQVMEPNQRETTAWLRLATVPFRWLGRGCVFCLRTIWTILCLPFTVMRFIRSVVTPASVTLILIGIITLNIVWGYPWTGVFASCLMLMAGGFLASRLFRPFLTMELSAPASAPAGQAFRVTTHLLNAGRFPTLDSSLKLKNRRGSRAIECQEIQSIPVLYPQQRCQLHFGLRAMQRGIHRLPFAKVTSSFPFSLFVSHRVIPTSETIAITPRPLAADEDEISCRLVTELGNWTRKLLTGDSMEYTGSREYQAGMPVRRWDFASWARLGRPIVREFSSSAVQEVTLLVDTSWNTGSEASARKSSAKNRKEYDFDLERLLSAATSALTQLTTRGVEVRLVVTGEPIERDSDGGTRMKATRELQPLLVRLAPAARVSLEVAQEEIERTIAELGNRAMLMLTTRSNTEEELGRGKTISIIHIAQQNRVDRAHASLTSKTRQPGRKKQTSNRHTEEAHAV